MNGISYAFGAEAATGAKNVKKFRTSREAVSEAVKYGWGFIVEYKQTRERRLKRSILGWRIQIISYGEAQKKYAEHPEILSMLDKAKKTDVFVISPYGRTEVIFPFKIEALRVVDIADLL